MNSEHANGGNKDLVHKCISDPGRSALDATCGGGEDDDRTRRLHRSTDTSTSGVAAGMAPAATSRKCVLTLDGYSYVIVASPPSSISGSCGGSGSHERRVVTVRDDNVAVGPPVTARTRVQLPKQGSLTIVRRSSNSGGRRSPSTSGGRQRFSPPTSVELDSVNTNSPTSSLYSSSPPSATATATATATRTATATMAIAPGDTDAAGTVNLAADNLPAVDTPDACDKAALRLRGLLCQLQSGEVSAQVLQRNLQYAARVLEAVYIDETRQNSSKMDATPSPQENATQTSPTSSAVKQTQTQQHGVLLHQQSMSTGGTTVPAVPQKRRLREPVWARSRLIALPHTFSHTFSAVLLQPPFLYCCPQTLKKKLPIVFFYLVTLYTTHNTVE